MTPVWIGMRVLEVRHWAIFFWGWCNGVMDSACDFDLLGESVPQVRVSARTLALLGFFQLVIYSDSLLSESYIFVLWAPWREVFSSVWLLALRERGRKKKGRAHLGGRCVKSTCNIFPWLPCGSGCVCWKSVIEPSFFEDGAMVWWIVPVISIC